MAGSPGVRGCRWQLHLQRAFPKVFRTPEDERCAPSAGAQEPHGLEAASSEPSDEILPFLIRGQSCFLFRLHFAQPAAMTAAADRCQQVGVPRGPSEEACRVFRRACCYDCADLKVVLRVLYLRCPLTLSLADMAIVNCLKHTGAAAARVAAAAAAELLLMLRACLPAEPIIQGAEHQEATKSEGALVIMLCGFALKV